MAEIDEGKSGLSRRQMIKASAIAGAAAWTAPVIIDSLASPAAAQSEPSIAVTCSWFYVVYMKSGDSAVYFTSANDSNAVCGNAQPPNNSGLRTKTCNGIVYTLPLNGTVPTAGGNPATNDPNCADFITISGSTLFAKGDATILAAFAHPGGGSVCSPCPSTSENNSISVCGTSACDG